MKLTQAILVATAAFSVVTGAVLAQQPAGRSLMPRPYGSFAPSAPAEGSRAITGFISDDSTVPAGGISYASHASPGCGAAGCSSYGCAAPGGCGDRRGACDSRPGCFCPTCRGWSTWGSIDYLMWWEKGRYVPAMVSTSPNGTIRDEAGVINSGFNTTVLFGDDDLGGGVQSGGRIDFGAWIDSRETIGVGVRVFGIEGASESYAANSPNADPILAQPFFNLSPAVNAEDALLIAYPGVSTGSVAVSTDRDFWSSEGYVRSLFDQGCNYRADLILGYHFLRLDDRLTNRYSITSIDPAGTVPVGTTLDGIDVFDVRNEFHGGEIGLRGDFRQRLVTIGLLAKISVGSMEQVATISGSTIVTEPGPVVTNRPGGLYSQTSNIGTERRHETVVIPEIGVQAGVDLTCRLRANIGYTFLWISDVATAGEQIDRVIDPRQQVGVVANRPGFAFQSNDHWMQGLNFGLSYTY